MPKESGRQRRRASPSRIAGVGSASAWRLVYQNLRDDIVSLRLKPGDPISEKEVAARYGVSRTPVREAIQRLADERLVEIYPQSGTFVARIPYDDLPEAMIIRKALETASVRLAAEKATRSQLLALATIVEQQREAAEANDRGAFHRADEAFHAKIAEVSGFPGIWRQVLQVKVQVDRYRRLTLSQQGRMAQVIADHERILAGIAAGNADDAERGMAHHLDAVLPDAPQEHAPPATD
ncbi:MULTISPECIES: GntR family transcriptional regulator [unclassified Devosia]|uniref:GntR family transcriptional regulator n=1 Tax=unclassified Devosia TaxID=196773 RepID=UPI0025C67B92|nr:MULTISPECIES: GntR family transcriptional regulator [unclassified Devosia]